MENDSRRKENMKKLLIILGLSLVLFSCNSNYQKKEVERISWYEADGVLIYAVDKFEYPYYFHDRYAYMESSKDTNLIYYINDIPEEVYNLYFKDAHEGDTIKI